MELVWTAFLLGLVGSLHCAMMCGPLMMAVSSVGKSSLSLAASRLAYNAGRIATYCLIGLAFGAVGKTFVFAGVQRWVSLLAGAAILLGLLISTRLALRTPATLLIMKMKSAFAGLLRRRSLSSQFLLGVMNGLLPCGLVYIAAAGAAATLSLWSGTLHMAAFGAGTLPMVLCIGVAGGRLRLLSMRFQKLIPISVIFVATLLLLRGMALGIPYVSPALNEHASHNCH